MEYSFSNGQFLENGKPLVYYLKNNHKELPAGREILFRTTPKNKAFISALMKGEIIEHITIQEIECVKVKVTGHIFTTSTLNMYPREIEEIGFVPITSIVKVEDKKEEKKPEEEK